MKVLLDTSVFLWLQAEPERVGTHREFIESTSTDLYLSVISAWEISINYACGRLALPEPPSRWVASRLGLLDAWPLSIELTDTFVAASLPAIHRDPFDRVVVAQALRLGATVMTSDRVFMSYSAPTIVVG